MKTNLSSKKNMALSDTQIENDQVNKEPILQKLVNFMDKLPIHKKMTIVVVSFVVIPLALLMTVSGLYMQEQLRRDQERYLISSLAIARSEMQERKNDIQRCCYTLAQDIDLQKAVARKDNTVLVKKIKLIQENFDKVDYAVVVDTQNNLLAKTDPSANYNADSPFGKMVRESLQETKSLSSTEVFQLSDLFQKDSELFKKFQIKLQDGFAGKGEYLNKCLSEITIVPIVNAETEEMLGAIALIGVANSDYYFPQYVSSRATEGFLVLTVDGVRVATKSTIGEEKKWMVGTPASPRPMRTSHGDYFIGTVNLHGIDYMFMDEPLTNSKGAIVGYISLGLPEERLNFLVTDNRKIGILISLLSILIFLPIGQVMASQLKRNHDELERMVKERTIHLETVVAQLKKLDIAKAQFLSNMTHELRTPLSVIINACDILKREYVGPLNEKQERNVQSALDCGNHLLLLINDLLDVSKMRAGMMLLNPSIINVKSLLDASVIPLKGLADKKAITMTIHREPDDFTIFGDPNRLKQIYYNIISNAIKFTGNNGHIDIYVFKRDVFMESIIKDNGIGIALEDQKRIFREFEQVDNSYTRRYPGTGLGLPIVKQLVELHGGQVYIDSKLGQGTEVIFTIPLEQTKK